MLLAPLAQGGMAEIWLARQSGLKGFEKLVVIKRMTGALEADPEYVEMFLTEARLAAQLNHPNIVQIYELGEQSGSLYIVMEYLDGENLAVLRRAGQKVGLPVLDAHAARLIASAADGLHYAHVKVGLDGSPLHIVHRDVSPQNLIATMEGGLKVVDFGIAKLASQNTSSGKLKGKFAYMSPEQARGEQVDARSDVFALGICLFELLTRTRFLPKMDDVQLLSTIAGTGPLPRPSERRADVPPGLEAVVLKALVRKKEERFQSARELHDALEEWLRSTSAAASSNDVADYLRTVFARRIHERRQLIEAAMKAELTPNSARNFAALAKGKGPDTGATSRSRAKPSPSAGRGKGLALGGVVAALLLAVVAGALALRPSSSDEEVSTLLEPSPEGGVKPPLVEAPASPVLILDTVPRGAAVVVDDKPRGQSPITLDGLSLGEHQVKVSLDGYQDSQRAVTLARPGERLVVELALAPLPPAVPLPSKDRPRPRAEAPQGKLTLKTTPWTTVYLGKQKLGDTPLIEVSIPAGKRVLRLVNPERGLESTIEVDIVSGETTVKKLSL
ncbi:MAG: serine/threonine protein kinase [Myxococcales bacterium]|nr:serine/threonine protein kinase [Myxococcales bacterium]